MKIKEKKNFAWIIQGLSWGLFMYIFMVFLFPLFDGEAITWKSVLTGIPVWTVGGLLFGYTMKLITNKKRKNDA